MPMVYFYELHEDDLVAAGAVWYDKDELKPGAVLMFLGASYTVLSVSRKGEITFHENENVRGSLYLLV